jgi:hypothetical protein
MLLGQRARALARALPFVRAVIGEFELRHFGVKARGVGHGCALAACDAERSCRWTDKAFAANFAIA